MPLGGTRQPIHCHCVQVKASSQACWNYLCSRPVAAAAPQEQWSAGEVGQKAATAPAAGVPLYHTPAANKTCLYSAMHVWGGMHRPCTACVCKVLVSPPKVKQHNASWWSYEVQTDLATKQNTLGQPSRVYLLSAGWPGTGSAQLVVSFAAVGNKAYPEMQHHKRRSHCTAAGEAELTAQLASALLLLQLGD